VSERRLTWLCAGALVVAVAVTMGRATTAGWMWLDDGLYVTRNVQVLAGLSWKGLEWAFTYDDGRDTYFHPLTWLSLMLDVQLFGQNPVAFHLVNLALHAATAVLLFLVAFAATGQRWASLGAALLFAVHPLQVESVVWITERKQVLGSALGLGAALAWVAHLGRPSAWRLALATALLALSILAKPHLVVLPVLLLLLDLWPLRRLAALAQDGAGAARQGVRFACAPLRTLLLEKWPLWAVSAAGAALVVVTLPPTTESGEPLRPAPIRLANAVARLVDYAGAVIWPHDLTVLRGFPHEVPAGEVLAGAALALLLTAGALLLVRRRPWLLFGWAWFLVALAPVSGLLQTGIWPSWADRFTYTPLMGVALAVAFEGAAWAARSTRARRAVLGAGAAAALGLGVATILQVEHWQSSTELFARAAALSPWHAGLRTMYASNLMNDERLEEALVELRASQRLDPTFPVTLQRIGETLHRLGRAEEAAAAFRETLRYWPNHAEAHFGLGWLAWEQGWTDVARFHLSRFLQLDVPDARDMAKWARVWLEGLEKAPPGTPWPLP
jgi:tetratricopeptide (TPR) repeat protein